MENKGLYIHIPFCKRKCSYCVFLSKIPENTGETKSVTAALQEEIRLYGKQYPKAKIDTVFIGGGTPSLLSPAEIKALLDEIRDVFQPDSPEITMESNPESLTSVAIPGYMAAGINRFSMGVQSFQEEGCRRLGRLHTGKQAMETFADLRRLGVGNINVDLMFAYPEQTMKEWKVDLGTVAALQPEHVSLYSLQLEEGTDFYRDYRKGKLDLPSDALAKDMYREACNVMEAAGYDHYEISNWAKTGYRCLHNEKYWQYKDFIGVGPGTSSFISGKRYKNIEDIHLWKEQVQQGVFPIETGTAGIDETVKKETFIDGVGIFCFTALRQREGISFAVFEKTFGRPFKKVYRHIWNQLEEYKEKGYITISRQQLALTREGIECSNDIMSAFLLDNDFEYPAMDTIKEDTHG